MNYSKMIGFPKPAPLALKGIGDEPMLPASDGAMMIMHKHSKPSMQGVKIDQHSSFPKGLPFGCCVHDERTR